MLLADIITSAARRYPDALAVEDESGALSYSALDSRVERIAFGLARSGVQPGDRVALISRNSIEMVACLYACFRAGAVAVPMNTRLTAAEIGYLLQDCGPVAAFVDPDLVDVAIDPMAGTERLGPVWVLGEGSAKAPIGWQPLADIAEGQRCGPWTRPSLSVDSLAALLYTSGTTSRPKGVMHTHATLWATAANQAWTQGFTSADKHLVNLSVAYIAGLAGQVLVAGYTGGALRMVRNGASSAEVFTAARDSRPTFAQMTPTILAQVLGLASGEAEALSSLRVVIAGGDVVPRRTHDLFRQLTGRHLVEACGMTESFSYAMNSADRPGPEGSIGRASHGTRIKIVDSAGVEVPPGVVGEINVSSQANMTGYWNNEAVTRETLAHGWVRTGDLGSSDDGGWLFFRGRAKRIIIRSGSNVSPLEVESVLLSHPGIAAAAVVGVPDADLGQRVFAFVCLAPGDQIEAPALRAFAAQQLAAYQIPETITILDSFPLNPTGKTDLQALERIAIDLEGGQTAR